MFDTFKIGGDVRAIARQASHDPARIIAAGFVIITVLVGAFATWAALAPLSSAVLAQGVVKVDTNRKTVQHLEGGIVKQILVKEGDVVKKDQPLIILEEEQIKASVDMYNGQILTELAASARLEAEKNLRPTIAFPGVIMARAAEPAVAKIIQAETRLFRARRESYSSQFELLKNQIQQTREELAGLQEQLVAAEQSIETLKEQLTGNRTLLKQGYVAKTVVLELERQHADKVGVKGELIAAMAKGEQKIIESELKMVATKTTYVQDAAKEFKEVENKRLELEDRVRPPRDSLARHVITAPIAGRVVDLKVSTVGGVIASREPLLDIVPLGDLLIIEGKVGVDHIRDLRVGQTAEIRLPAYNQRTTPKVRGTVTYVSADRLSDKNMVNPTPPYYLVYVEVNRTSLKEAGNLELYPGMSAELAIQIQSRTAFDYFVTPISARMGKAFREP